MKGVTRLPSPFAGARSRSRESGFTLLEMLVAVAILSIAALALVRLDAFTVRGTADLTASATAQIVADNVAVELLTDPAAPTIGNAQRSASNGGSTWQVATLTAPTADPSLLRVDIVVTGSVGRATRTIIRPAG